MPEEELAGARPLLRSSLSMLILSMNCLQSVEYGQTVEQPVLFAFSKVKLLSRQLVL